MTQERPRNPRVLLMLSAAALLSTPAVAQTAPEAQGAPQAAPVQVTPPAPPAAVPAPAAPAPVAAAAGDSPTPVNAEAAAQAAAEEAQFAAERRATRRAEVRRPAPVRETARNAAAPRPEQPARFTPSSATGPAPLAQAPVPKAPEPAQATTTTAPGAAAPVVAQTRTTQTERGTAWWPVALIAALVAAAAAGVVLLMRRRRAAAEDGWGQPAQIVPITAAEPVPAPAPAYDAPFEEAPAIAVDAEVVRADGDDVDALTAADAPADRPWLEFAMRPVRAGTSADEALVEIELTIGNAGNIAAEDVRIATFMLAEGQDGEMERWLIEPHDDAVAPMTIAAGEGARVDATLAISRATLGEGSFRPLIVADARYRLPDGSEGRTSASFLVGGATDVGSPAPIDLDRRGLSDDVEAQLYRQPERV